MANNKSVGKLIFTIGKVIIIKPAGKQKRVRRGAKIYEGDLLKTHKKGQAQIKFTDGARVSVRPNSEFKVEAYTYNKANTQESKSELSLLKGGIRAVTGAIGKGNKKSYKMKAVVATIGIRGTDYSLMLCDQNCGGNSANRGLYVGVVSGGVTLNNDAGKMDLAPNQYAKVGSVNSIPTMLPKAPTFLMFDKTAASKRERSKVTKSFARAKRSGVKSKSAQKSNDNGANGSSQVSSKPASAADSSKSVKQTSGNSSSSESQTVTQEDSQKRPPNSQPAPSPVNSVISATTNRYSENSTIEIPTDVVSSVPEIGGAESTLTINNVSEEVASNIEPSEDVISVTSEENEENVAVGIDDENTNTVGDGDSSDNVEPEDTSSNEEGLTALSRFFRFIIGSDNTEDAFAINESDTNKVDGLFHTESVNSVVINEVEYSQGTATLNNYGYDPETGLSWGRWSEGNISKITHTPENSSPESIDLSNQSLHWIMGPDRLDNVELRTTGTRNYVLIGNTNPTDNFGNEGILGSATLSADFENRTVDADVKISIDQRVWLGEQQNIPLNMDNGNFHSDQMNIQVDGGTDTAGSLSGGLIEGETNAAGFTYGMEATINGETNRVNGAAVFKEAP